MDGTEDMSTQTDTKREAKRAQRRARRARRIERNHQRAAMNIAEHDRGKDLTYTTIRSPLTFGYTVLSAAAVLGAGFIVTGGSTDANASLWDDEIIEEEEIPEGIELYDARATTVSSAEGEYIRARSTTSPDLFENIGDGSFQVEWDVDILPAEGVEDNERIDVYLFYDSSIDANIQIERCESTYPAPPNYVPDAMSDTAVNTQCGGDTQSWESVDIAASGYLGNLAVAEPIGDFMLQNQAHLRMTVAPGSEISMGDVLDSLEIYAEGFGERVIVGHTEDSGRVVSADEPMPTAAPGEDEYGEEDYTAPDEDGLAEEEPEESPEPVEPTEDPEPSPETELEPQVTPEEPAEEAPADADAAAEEFDMLTWGIIGAALLVLIGIGVFAFLKKRKKRGYQEHEDAGYLDEDDTDDSESHEDRNRYSKNSLYFD